MAETVEQRLVANGAKWEAALEAGSLDVALACQQTYLELQQQLTNN